VGGTAVLRAQPDDQDAQLVRLAVLVRLGSFDAALTLCGRLLPADRAARAFEEAYCLYRLGRPADALALLATTPEPAPRRIRILRAQIVRHTPTLALPGPGV
jgi:hypothetical protein